MNAGQGPSTLREEFKDAVDPFNSVTDDELNKLTGELWNCTDIMPNETCENVGVPTGSTYAQGARYLRASLQV